MREENIFETTGVKRQTERETSIAEHGIKRKYEELEKWGSVLLGASGWRIEINPAIRTAAADFKNRILYFGVRCEDIIADPDQEKNELKRLFVFSHEVMHFAQALEDPEEYLSTFQIAEEKAREFSQKYKVDEKDMEDAFHHFFNVFLDVDDNGKVVRRNKKLQEETGDICTKELYAKLFPGNDFSKAPLYEQYTDALLARVMDDGRDIRTSPETAGLLNGEFQYLGKKYSSLPEFIKKEIYDPNISFSKAMFRIKTILQPQFEELLKKDLEQGTYRGPKEGGSIDRGVDGKGIKDFIRGVLKENISTKERMGEQMGKDFKKKAEQGGFSEKNIREMEKIMRNTDDIWPKMIKLWEEFFSVSKSYSDAQEGYFRSGQSFSAKKFIHDLPEFISDPGAAKPFTRITAVENQEKWKPKKISLVFITDLSGSMGSAERQAVQETAYCIAKSLIQFQRNQIVKSDDDKSPVETYLRNIGFGTDTRELFELTPEEIKARAIDPKSDNLDKRIWQSILDIGTVDLGGTNDSLPLAKARDGAEEAREALNNNEETAVIVELTDGDPDKGIKDISKKLVKALNGQKNVYCRSIRIGGSSNDFKDIWGEYGQPLGDVADLKEVFMKILKDIFTGRPNPS